MSLNLRLDLTLGLRMLARYPGLTLVGATAMAVAIALGAIYFEGVNKWQHPRLPVAGADRVVAIRSWDLARAEPESRLLGDLDSLPQARTIVDLGAAVGFVRNLATEDGRVEPVRGAELSASAFDMLGVAPLMGRALTARDELPGEPLVVVLGESLWRARFDSDPAVLGRTVRLGAASATVVGVMPGSFGFPVNQRVWLPLRTAGSVLEPRTGPQASVFGRLAPGASARDAEVELELIRSRQAATDPDAYAHTRTLVTPYGEPPATGGVRRVLRNALYGANVVFLLLLAIVCTNVATLVYARTATRGWEIAVRNALGATRARIVAQLFIEALVLAVVAAITGLLIARVALGFGLGMLVGNDALPYWIDAGISWRTILYAVLLALAAATMVGVLPALRVTRADLHRSLRAEGASRARLRFGGFWTIVIVAQVALTVALLPIAAGGISESNRFQQRADGIGAERYLTARVDLDRDELALDSAAFRTRVQESLGELERRLLTEPGVEQVAFADRLPVMDQFKYRIELDSVPGANDAGLRTSTLVQTSSSRYFDAFGTTVVAGRELQPLDFQSGRVVVVNSSFVRYVLDGQNPIGRRVRVVGGEDDSIAGPEWYEIVGVVGDFGWQLPLPQEQSAVYMPRSFGDADRTNLAVRLTTRDAAASFAPRLRAIAADVDPTMRLMEVQPLTSVGGGEARINWTLTWVAWVVALVVMLLSAAGIHALTSFTVAQRTREIGIRTALGANPRRLMINIFSRVAIQVGAGVLAGTAIAASLGISSIQDVLVLVGVDGAMLLVGALACAAPVRRALRVDPVEALRAE